MAEQSKLGKNEILFIYTSLKDAEGEVIAANYFPVGCLTTNDLSKTIEMQDGTITKCNTSPDPIYGKKSYQITFEAISIEDEGTRASYNAVSDAMDAAYENNTPIFWKQETTLSDDSKEVMYGKAFLTELSKSAPVEGEVTFSGTLVGSGEISKTDLKV